MDTQDMVVQSTLTALRQIYCGVVVSNAMPGLKEISFAS
jgi:hypothetical protein